MGKRRGNNEGTVFKRESDGKWVGAVTLGYNKQGNPNRRVVYGNTRAEAAKKLADLLDKFNKGILAGPSTLTVTEFAKGWLERETVGKTRSTKRSYDYDLRPALTHLGGMRVQAVKPLHVRQMLDRMSQEGWAPKPTKAQEKKGEKPTPRPYSSRSQRATLQRLATVFRDAVQMEIIHRNPCEAVKVKAAPSEPVGRVLEPAELGRLLGACEADPMGLFFRLVLDTGLRKGEALALTWGDIDLIATPPRLSVSKAWTGSGKEGHFTTPKTRGSRRIVLIPPSSAGPLRALRSATVSKYGEGITGLYLFGSPVNNTPVESSTPNHILKRLCVQAGVTPLRVHDLRHTFGSTLLANQVPLEVVSEWMGHANPTITLNVYRHLLERERTEYLFSVTDTATPLEAAPTPAALPN